MRINTQIERLQTPDGHTLALSPGAVTLEFEPGAILSREVWLLEIREGVEWMVSEHRRAGLDVCSEGYLAGLDALLRVVQGDNS